MQLNELQALASRTLPDPGRNHWFSGHVFTNSPHTHEVKIDLMHACLGMSGEAAEVSEHIKKAMYYGKPLDLLKIKEEAGDLLWYIAGPLCRALGCTLEEIAAANVDKLRKRYPEKYSDEAAVARVDIVATNVEDNEPFTLPDGWRVPTGYTLANLKKWQAREILARYSKYTIESGFYFDDANPSEGWQLIEELFTLSPSQTALQNGR